MRSRRLKKSDFATIYQRGKRYTSALFSAYVLPGEGTAVAFVASRAVGNAVRRNRAKRVLRAAWELSGAAAHAFSASIVLNARAAIIDKKANEVSLALQDIMRRWPGSR